jgi:hypothetical protein
VATVEHLFVERGRAVAESAPSGNELQQRYDEFLGLLPLTAALAGLPASAGRLLQEEQIEGRATTFRAAFKVAKTLLDELTSGDAAQQRQFRSLLPATIALAGLPPSEARLFTSDQLEARSLTVRAAYRVARATAKECLGGS